MTKHLVLYQLIICICYENDMEHVNKMCEQNIVIFLTS